MLCEMKDTNDEQNSPQSAIFRIEIAFLSLFSLKDEKYEEPKKRNLYDKDCVFMFASSEANLFTWPHENMVPLRT